MAALILKACTIRTSCSANAYSYTQYCCCVLVELLIPKCLCHTQCDMCSTGVLGVLYLICYLCMNCQDKEVKINIIIYSISILVISLPTGSEWALLKSFSCGYTQSVTHNEEKQPWGGSNFCWKLVLCFQLPFVVLNVSWSKFFER